MLQSGQRYAGQGILSDWGPGEDVPSKAFLANWKKKKKRRPKGPLGILLNILSIQNRKSTCNWCQAQDKINKKKNPQAKTSNWKYFLNDLTENPVSGWISFREKGTWAWAPYWKTRKSFREKKKWAKPRCKLSEVLGFFSFLIGTFRHLHGKCHRSTVRLEVRKQV